MKTIPTPEVAKTIAARLAHQQLEDYYNDIGDALIDTVAGASPKDSITIALSGDSMISKIFPRLQEVFRAKGWDIISSSTSDECIIKITPLREVA